MLQSKHPLKRVLVLGLGMSGQSAARFLLKRGAFVVGLDSNAQLITNPEVSRLVLAGMDFFHDSHPINFDHYDLIVVSPGIPTSHPIYRKAVEFGLEVIGEVELACREIDKKCVAVTGTNGKTTVTMLTTHVLQFAGIKAKALGNIGMPLTAAVDELENQQADVFVIELSSFQLETLKTKFIDAGVILNITPDHLDRYASVTDYAAAKIGMEKNLKNDGVLFVERKCLDEYGALFSENHHLSYGYDSKDHLQCSQNGIRYRENLLWDANELNRVMRPNKVGNVGLQKSHHLENIMAAYGLCSTFSITPQQFLTGLASFQKPAHRIEFVRTLDGVNYYDDSKGTNIDAVIRAVEELDGEIILIAGGVDKGFPYTKWIGPFKDKVKVICAIGQSREKIQNDLEKFIPVIPFESFKDAVMHAVSLAKQGDNILLSPGCSSFDMFKDYAHRGQEFQRIVNAL